MKKFILAAGTSLLLLTTAFAQKGKVNSASISLQSGDIQKAKEFIDEATVNPESSILPKTWLVRGDVYKGIYETIIHFKENPEALFTAKEAYLKAYELEINPKKKDDTKAGLTDLSNYFYKEGVGFFKDQKFEPAYKNFKAQLEINEFMIKNNLATVIDTNAYFVVALTAFNTNRFDDVISAADKLMGMNYNDETLYVIASESYKQKGDKEGQMKVVEKGLAKFPTNKDLIFAEINYYLEQDKTDVLINKLETAIKVDPKNPSLYQALATIYDNLNKPELSLANYDKAIELKPDMYEAYYNKGTIFFKEAMLVVGKMNEENDNKKYEVLRVQKDDLLKKCLPLFEKAYELKPEDPAVIKALREVYVRLNMLDKAKTLPKN